MPATPARIGFITQDYRVVTSGPDTAVQAKYGSMARNTDDPLPTFFDAVVTRRLDKVAVKGKKEPVVIYEAMDLKENATQERVNLARDFEAALDLYFSRQFEHAIESCEAILKTHPEDGPTKNLLERAKVFQTTPPPAGWNGTWVFTKK
jgi:hypothetical protein